MKKIFAFCLAALLLVGLVGCGGEPASPVEEATLVEVVNDRFNITPEEFVKNLNLAAGYALVGEGEFLEIDLEEGMLYFKESAVLNGVGIGLQVADGEENARYIYVVPPSEDSDSEYSSVDFDTMCLFALESIAGESDDFVSSAIVMLALDRGGSPQREGLTGDVVSCLISDDGWFMIFPN